MHESLRKITALTLHYLYSVRRNPARLIEMFLWPAFELLIFVLLAQGIHRDLPEAVPVAAGIAAGVVFWTSTARVIQEAVAQFADDFFSKNIQHVLAAPVSVGQLCISVLCASLLKLLPSYAVLLFLLSLLGQGPVLAVVGAGWISVLLLVFFGGALALFGVGLLFLFGERVSFAGWIISTLVGVVSCVYYARAVLPAPLYTLSFFVPSSYVFEALRHFITAGTWDESALTTSLVVSLLYYLVAIAFVRFSFRAGRRSGIFAKA